MSSARWSLRGCVQITLLAICLSMCLPAGVAAQTGTISGRVTDEATGNPLAGIVSYAPPGGSWHVAFTDGSGNYSATGVAPGLYYVYVSPFDSNHVGEIYDNIPCAGECPLNLATLVLVQSGATTSNIDFALATGGVITGVVTDATSGAPLDGVYVYIYTAAGGSASFGLTNAAGIYATSAKLPTGTYVAVTDARELNYLNELYDNFACQPQTSCPIASGTPIAVTVGATTSGINFALNPGGRITGTVTDAVSGLPLGSASVTVYTPGGQPMGSALSAGNGTYAVTALPTGSYRLVVGHSTHVTELYNDIPCDGPCLVASGTPIAVTAGNQTAGINVALGLLGGITGFVTSAETGAPLGGMSVSVLNALGQFLDVTFTNSSGAYSFAGLGTGTYIVRVQPGFFWVPPPPLQVNVTTGVTTTGVNFTVMSNNTGILGGYIRNDGGQGLGFVRVELLKSDGSLQAWTMTETGGCDECGPAGSYFFNPPAGTYFLRTRSDGGYIDEVHDNIACVPECSLAAATPLVVSAFGHTTIDFFLAPAGHIAGRVTDAVSGAGIADVIVSVHHQGGALAGVARTNGTGDYAVGGLTAGTYFARTGNTLGYQNEVYNGQTFCAPSCRVTDGLGIPVVTAQTTPSIDFALSATSELIQNGDFSSGLAPWGVFATPDVSYISWDITSAVFRFNRLAPPPGTSNQAVILQYTGAAVPVDAGLVAEFDLGNSSSVRKRITVLVHDSDFSDLAACTFWLPPNRARYRYTMRAHTTKAWANATIAFYAASAGGLDGQYEIDDVSLQAVPGSAVDRIDCLEPLPPAAPGGADGPEWLVNGNFASGSVSPGWGTFGFIDWQVASGVFEFLKLAGAPAGVVLQPTGQAVAVNQILTATFDLGNSSVVRKRVTVILHDGNFSDLAACTLWIPPGQPLSTYTVRMYTTQPWTNATLSVYPATTGLEQWIQLDNASLKRTPSAVVFGTECVEPGGSAARSRR